MNISDALFVLLITFWGFCAFDMRFFSRQSLRCLAWFPFLVLLVFNVWMGVFCLCNKDHGDVLYRRVILSCSWRRWRDEDVGENLDVWWFQHTVDLFVTMSWVIIEKEGIIPVFLLVLCYVWGCHWYFCKIRVSKCRIYPRNYQSK